MSETEDRLRKILLGIGTPFERSRETFWQQPALRGAHTVDIVIRKDGVDYRVEADWLKDIARALFPPQPMREIDRYQPSDASWFK